VIAAVPLPVVSPVKVIVLFGAAVIAELTNSVVAMLVSLSPGAGVTARASPVKIGALIGA
jgi:hypothetical protein